MAAQKIIIDTDPGQDDAVALLLALASPKELEILGVTTVAGNVPLKLTSRNARIICELADRPEVGVYAGSDRPLRRDLVTAEYVHGKTGLDGADLPEPTMPLQPTEAADFIVEAVLGTKPGTVTLCTLGPLTNIGTALQREPRLASSLQQIVMMGGGFFEGGNTTPTAEFNIYVDPEAAALVFTSGIPITMMPLDVTHRALTTPEFIGQVKALGTPVGQATAGRLQFYEQYDRRRYGTSGAPLHDPCVIAYLLKPQLFRGRACNVEVETLSSLTLGMTVVDWWGQTDRPRNAMVMRDIDADDYFDLIVERLSEL
ncbi:MAG: nucleoside hydrolase [Acidimicrobiia bacterium]